MDNPGSLGDPRGALGPWEAYRPLRGPVQGLIDLVLGLAQNHGTYPWFWVILRL